MPTVLITGCSSGFGLETAKLFLKKGWKVVATMRKPRADILPTSNDLTILPLDVTDSASVASAVEQAGEFDVLVNNAGFGAAVPIELIDPETARLLFETNTLGTLGDAASGPAKISRTPQRHDYQRHLDGDAQAASIGQRLSCKQGGGERAYRKPCGGNGAVRRARAYRAPRPFARDQLRRQCDAASARAR